MIQTVKFSDANHSQTAQCLNLKRRFWASQQLVISVLGQNSEKKLLVLKKES